MLSKLFGGESRKGNLGGRYNVNNGSSDAETRVSSLRASSTSRISRRNLFGFFKPDVTQEDDDDGDEETPVRTLIRLPGGRSQTFNFTSSRFFSQLSDPFF